MPDSTSDRATLVDSAHVRSLNQWVRGQCQRGRALPFFDPLDGGERARVMVLLESPARHAATPRFVSRDNPVPAQKNLKHFLEQVALPRNETILWNAVPWLPSAGETKKPLRKADLQEGTVMLLDVLSRLPRLHSIVFAGRIAQQCMPSVKESFPLLALFGMPHPSPLSICTSAEVTKRILSVLSEAKRWLQTAPAAPREA
ncbi:uracil-DNA glycosylase [Xanthomonas arboricola]|uniref:uracil-DNA glycosylase n=1 Tax=Xanthomonas arboricola TaxID=56448 RepID=UPI000CEEC8A6|nr:uracil-DNA glycosylase [Xanthomonas arboricola]PPU21871.1 hypothetical protein XarbCFBP7610_00630 [Xanthomonas arboricola]